MDQKDLIQTLHNLDKRVAVIETLQKERNLKSSEEHAAIMSELTKTRETVTSMRVKHATLSASVALVVSYLIHIFVSK